MSMKEEYIGSLKCHYFDTSELIYSNWLQIQFSLILRGQKKRDRMLYTWNLSFSFGHT